MRGNRGFGAALWALFVAVAIGSGWAAVQMVGAALAPASVAVLSADEVTQRLATSRPLADNGPGNAPTPSRSTTPTKQASPTPNRTSNQPAPSTPAATTAAPSTPPSTPAATSAPPSKPAPKPHVRTLVSRGGSVVAECTRSTVYLRSVSPALGYRVDDWDRGPAAETEVRFVGSAAEVTMKVTCAGGVPTSDTEVDTGSGDDH